MSKDMNNTQQDTGVDITEEDGWIIIKYEKQTSVDDGGGDNSQAMRTATAQAASALTVKQGGRLTEESTISKTGDEVHATEDAADETTVKERGRGKKPRFLGTRGHHRGRGRDRGGKGRQHQDPGHNPPYWDPKPRRRSLSHQEACVADG